LFFLETGVWQLESVFKWYGL